MSLEIVKDPIGVNEVMEILDCSRASVYNYIKKGLIVARETGLGKPAFSRREIEKLKEVVK